ncbi:hypothetical protein ACOME3_007284 [Neoechinorhynchus agilis]
MLTCLLMIRDCRRMLKSTAGLLMLNDSQLYAFKSSPIQKDQCALFYWSFIVIDVNWWRRYVDDVFILTDSNNNRDTLNGELNSQDPHIQWTINEENINESVAIGFTSSKTQNSMKQWLLNNTIRELDRERRKLSQMLEMNHIRLIGLTDKD